MAEYIIMMLIVAAFMAILADIFVKGALSAKQENRKIKFGFAILGGVIAILSIGILLCCGFLSKNNLILAVFALPFFTIPLSWLAMFIVKGIWKKIATFFIPTVPLCVSLVAIVAAMGGVESPLEKSDVIYTSQEEVEELLGVGALPKLRFDKAVGLPAANKVILSLEDPADTTRLEEVYKKLCQTRSLQCGEMYFDTRVYHVVDDKQEGYTNVFWFKNGIEILYGEIWPKESSNNHFFDSIQAPIPKYDYITYNAVSCGQDWSHEQRIRFQPPISEAWLKKVENAAKTDSAWKFGEDRDYIHINFDNSRYYIFMKIHKHLEGERTIADVEWGNY